MSFTFHQGGVVISNQNKHSQLPNTRPLAYTPSTCASTAVVAPFSQFCPNRIMQRHPTPVHVLSHQSAGGRSEKTQEPYKYDRVVQGHLHVHQGSPFLPIFRPLSRCFHPHLTDAHPFNLSRSIHTIPST